VRFQRIPPSLAVGVRRGVATIALTTQPLWLLAGIAVVATLLAAAGPVVVRRFIGLERLGANNEVAGFKFANVGVLYAVLLAFAVILVWEEYNDAAKAVVDEAGAAVSVYRLADGIGGAPGKSIHDTLSAYLKSAIADDWPAMAEGGASPVANRALNAVYAAALTFHPADLRDAGIQGEILRQLDTLTRARRDRLDMAEGTAPGVIWFVLFGGSLVTVCFTFFFGTENLRAQSLMTGILAAMIFAVLVVVIAIDHPFAGEVHVTPDPLAAALADFTAVP